MPGVYPPKRNPVSDKLAGAFYVSTKEEPMRQNYPVPVTQLQRLYCCLEGDGMKKTLDVRRICEQLGIDIHKFGLK